MVRSLSFFQNLTQLQQLYLGYTQVNGSLSFLQNLTQLQDLHLSYTQVNGGITALPQLTSLVEFGVKDSQVVSVPTEPELASFAQQHPNCVLEHDE